MQWLLWLMLHQPIDHPERLAAPYMDRIGTAIQSQLDSIARLRSGSCLQVNTSFHIGCSEGRLPALSSLCPKAVYDTEGPETFSVVTLDRTKGSPAGKVCGPSVSMLADNHWHAFSKAISSTWAFFIRGESDRKGSKRLQLLFDFPGYKEIQP